MKKTMSIVTAALALGLAFVPVASVHADDTDSKNTTAQFGVSGGTITIDEVPDLRFNDITVEKAVSTGDDLKLSSGTVDQLTGATDGKANTQIKVTDNRGTNEGWSLSAQTGQFLFGSGTATSPADINVTGITFNTVGVSSTGASANAFITTGSITDSGTVLWTADDSRTATTQNYGTGTNTAKVTDATLALAQSKNAKAGTYRAPITWTLTTGPDGSDTNSTGSGN
ncbi:WxL domain-containing protein [Lacticaseibacillus porcinae]|uniref:WxL domain-containing protein n=1 Tax=Lacticaseibacillus porcinae TaxID=1123687 RepID=UPI0013DE111E|nr:WxL domain-containing protein [Lacticaseibacillus porcinae]